MSAITDWQPQTSACGPVVRIAFLLPSLGMGGAERQLLALLRHMDLDRFRSTLLVMHLRPDDLKYEFATIPGLQIHNLGKKNRLDFRFLLRLNRILAAESFDVLYAINASARLFAFLAGRWRGVPRIVFAERNSAPIYSSLGSRLYHFFEARLFPLADHIVTNSPSGQEFCRKRGVPDGQIHLIANGLEAAGNGKVIERQSTVPVIGMVARFTRQKDHETFLLAAKRILEVLPEVRFLLVGDGPRLPVMHNLAEELGIADLVSFVGQQPKAREWMQQMDLVVLTSRLAEGCPNSIIEAMSLGIPVIATDVSGTRDWIRHGETGFLVSPKNPQELAQRLLTCLRDPSTAQVGARAAEFAQFTFANERMVRDFEKFFAGLMPPHHGQTLDYRKSRLPVSAAFGASLPVANLFGYSLGRLTIERCVELVDSIIPAEWPVHIVLVNAAKIVKARWDRELELIIRQADLVGADGMPIVWLSRLVGQAIPGRLNGTDLMYRLLDLAQTRHYRVYLLGARSHVIESAVSFMQQRYPLLPIAGYHSGYFASPEEVEKTIDEIADCKPDILLIGMSSPMKEKWVHRYKHRLPVSIIHGVGGSFDILGGLTSRAPFWMQRSGLEWLYRLMQEPRRLWKRYLLLNTLFLFFSGKEIASSCKRKLLHHKKNTRRFS
ncbi:WecB/TagA/CpsF family glycosyltransferase [candidate division KSB1 bacterium]|nr:WecB/TagA/CpsF family glycosyltransferase [candidate division KSB1 bacterium]